MGRGGEEVNLARCVVVVGRRCRSETDGAEVGAMKVATDAGGGGGCGDEVSASCGRVWRVAARHVDCSSGVA
jgi:hypothetical protein